MTDPDIARSLGRMEGKLDMLIDRFDKVDERVGAIEKKQWYHSGALGFAALFLVPKVRATLGL